MNICNITGTGFTGIIKIATIALMAAHRSGIALAAKIHRMPSADTLPAMQSLGAAGGLVKHPPKHRSQYSLVQGNRTGSQNGLQRHPRSFRRYAVPTLQHYSIEEGVPDSQQPNDPIYHPHGSMLKLDNATHQPFGSANRLDNANPINNMRRYYSNIDISSKSFDPAKANRAFIIKDKSQNSYSESGYSENGYSENGCIVEHPHTLVWCDVLNLRCKECEKVIEFNDIIRHLKNWRNNGHLQCKNRVARNHSDRNVADRSRPNKTHKPFNALENGSDIKSKRELINEIMTITSLEFLLFSLGLARSELRLFLKCYNGESLEASNMISIVGMNIKNIYQNWEIASTQYDSSKWDMNMKRAFLCYTSHRLLEKHQAPIEANSFLIKTNADSMSAKNVRMPKIRTLVETNNYLVGYNASLIQRYADELKSICGSKVIASPMTKTLVFAKIISLFNGVDKATISRMAVMIHDLINDELDIKSPALKYIYKTICFDEHDMKSLELIFIGRVFFMENGCEARTSDLCQNYVRLFPNYLLADILGLSSKIAKILNSKGQNDKAENCREFHELLAELFKHYCNDLYPPPLTDVANFLAMCHRDENLNILQPKLMKYLRSRLRRLTFIDMIRQIKSHELIDKAEVYYYVFGALPQPRRGNPCIGSYPYNTPPPPIAVGGCPCNTPIAIGSYPYNTPPPPIMENRHLPPQLGETAYYAPNASALSNMCALNNAFALGNMCAVNNAFVLGSANSNHILSGAGHSPETRKAINNEYLSNLPVKKLSYGLLCQEFYVGITETTSQVSTITVACEMHRFWRVNRDMHGSIVDYFRNFRDYAYCEYMRGCQLCLIINYEEKLRIQAESATISLGPVPSPNPTAAYNGAVAYDATAVYDDTTVCDECLVDPKCDIARIREDGSIATKQYNALSVISGNEDHCARVFAGGNRDAYIEECVEVYKKCFHSFQYQLHNLKTYYKDSPVKCSMYGLHQYLCDLVERTQRTDLLGDLRDRFSLPEASNYTEYGDITIGLIITQEQTRNSWIENYSNHAILSVLKRMVRKSHPWMENSPPEHQYRYLNRVIKKLLINRVPLSMLFVRYFCRSKCAGSPLLVNYFKEIYYVLNGIEVDEFRAGNPSNESSPAANKMNANSRHGGNASNLVLYQEDKKIIRGNEAHVNRLFLDSNSLFEKIIQGIEEFGSKENYAAMKQFQYKWEFKRHLLKYVALFSEPGWIIKLNVINTSISTAFLKHLKGVLRNYLVIVRKCNSKQISSEEYIRAFDDLISMDDLANKDLLLACC